MELLAPAGTYDCLVAAVNSGADAVYFAGKGFGARSFAGNFSEDEIRRAAEFCGLRNVRTYLTVNTLVFDRELAELEKFIKVITKAGIDAVIVQDLGVLRVIREMSPDIELHGSTQMTVHSADGVRELEKLGVSRVVLSRELSGKEISEIINTASAEAEVFVHGAMCMSYSGQCLMSSVIGGRSGNRGKCAQPCRLPYSSDGKNQRFYLSLKDMSLAEHIRELSDMGVASLKIEGRMKGEKYVSEVVSIYRRLIDENRTPDKKELDRLNRVFFRGGLTDGYFTDKKGKSMFAFDKPDNPYLKNSDEGMEIREKQLPAKIRACFAEDEKPMILIECGEYSAKVEGDFTVEAAAKRAATEESVAAQLCKTGGTAFYIEDTDISLKGELFLPVSSLNELRRKAVGRLEEEILSGIRNKRLNKREEKLPEPTEWERGCVCSVLNMEQYRAVRKYNFKRIYVPLHLASELVDDKDRVVISLPVILRGEQRDKCRIELEKLRQRGICKAEISTIDALPLCEGYEVYGSQRLNITNSIASDEYRKKGLSGICLSAEMNLGQMRDIVKSVPAEAVAYGRIPIMITENCMLKNMDKCPCGGVGKIVDRTGTEFPVVRDGDACRSVVLNSVPLYMGDKLEDLKRTGADLRLIFTTEDADRVNEICEDYFSGIKSGEFKFTRLHYYKSAIE